jgi:asparagine synthetase B (glutamine-hydrolysing)
MSGIYGFCVQNGDFKPEALLNKMKEAVPAQGQTVDAQWTSNKKNIVGLGVRHPTRVNAPGNYAEDPIAGVQCVFDGVIYPHNVSNGGDLIERDGAKYLLSHYLNSGPACVAQLNGSFNVVWWDARSQRLIIANDKIGHRLLFFGHANGAIAFASLVARVLGSGLIVPEIDLNGFADLINYGYILGERTLFQSIKTLPPAGILIYENSKVQIKRYWSVDEIETHGEYNNQRLDEVQEVFRMAVRRSFRTDLQVALDLTGGLDSRCILAAAANLNLPYLTHTGGQSDSTDVVLAQEASEVVDAPHYFEPIGPQKINRWLYPMVLHLGGMVSTVHSHPCQHFSMPMPFDAVVQGTGTSFIHGVWGVTNENCNIQNSAIVNRHLEKVMRSGTAKQIKVEDLWRAKYRELGINARNDHLYELMRQVKPEANLVDIVSYIHLYERCRKALNKAILIVRNVREAYFPLIDHELIAVLAAIPPSNRIGVNKRQIELDLIRRLCPQLLDIPWEKSLIRLSASSFEQWGIQKFRSLNRRLTRWAKFPDWTPKKVPAHYFKLWTRHEMKNTLLPLLSAPDAAFKNYLDHKLIDTLVSQHFSGKTSYRHLIATLTVLEICHRLWVDPDPEIMDRALAS